MFLTLWGHGLSLFRINLPIQTFSALNFRGECVLDGGGPLQGFSLGSPSLLGERDGALVQAGRERKRVL